LPVHRGRRDARLLRDFAIEIQPLRLHEALEAAQLLTAWPGEDDRWHRFNVESVGNLQRGVVEHGALEAELILETGVALGLLADDPCVDRIAKSATGGFDHGHRHDASRAVFFDEAEQRLAPARELLSIAGRIFQRKCRQIPLGGDRLLGTRISGHRGPPAETCHEHTIRRQARAVNESDQEIE